MLAPAVVLPALELILSFIGTVTSAFMAVQATENIYSTAQGDENIYEKARAFAKDGTILVTSVIACGGLAAATIKNEKLVKNILAELKTRTFTSMRYDFRLMQRLAVTDLDGALGMAEGKVDGEALALLEQEAAGYRDTQLREVVEAIDRVSDEIGGKLDSRTVSRILKELKENDADNMEDVANVILSWINNGGYKSIDIGDLKIIQIKTPELANNEWIARGYDKPPYDVNYEVVVVEAGSEEYVRVFSNNENGISNKLGGWLMRQSDIKDLTPIEIAEKYALPQKPTHMCDVNVPENFSLQAGIANAIEGWGNGGSLQFDTMGKRLPKSAFVNERLIGE